MAETEWIKRYIVPLVTAEGADGLRDDVAILSSDGTIIANVDMLIEGIHFLERDPIDTVGQKLVRVNVSDIVAKGAEPLEALLSIAWPRGWVEADFADLIAGIARDFEHFGISLVGGDTVGTEGPLSLSLTLTGRCLGPRPVRRGGARAGQGLFVSGEIGWGHLGLEAALSGDNPAVAERYRVPQIGGVDLARTIAEHASASMDVSDGLLIDVTRIGESSDCGVHVELEEIPLAQPSGDLDIIMDQCTGGDDYLALIAADSQLDLPGFTKIGTLTAEHGLRLTYKGQDFNPPVTLGFEH
ncbi:MAG: thiamine-phosphate kinase [Alphaproteobacteria bacterium]|nr:thiamine-phosphate kinase [Alphaproteobacteria bacterium]